MARVEDSTVDHSLRRGSRNLLLGLGLLLSSTSLVALWEIITTRSLSGILVATGCLLSLVLLSLVTRIQRAYLAQLTSWYEREVDRLEQDALTDHLTGLGNQRAFAQTLDEAVAVAVRYDDPLTLVLIDLDNLKILNDTNGHAFGDEMLARMGDILKLVRRSDRGFRIGGDEFALILPHTTGEAAIILVKHLQRQVRHALLGGTASFGYASVAPDTQTTTMLRRRADQALYAAKRSGRDRVVGRDAGSGEGTTIVGA